MVGSPIVFLLPRMKKIRPGDLDRMGTAVLGFPVFLHSQALIGGNGYATDRTRSRT
jgi:hypothetical protein